jgi:hypothetical protein
MRTFSGIRRVLLRAVPFVALGCTARAYPDDVPQDVILLRCTPQPEAEATAVTGPAGDTLYVGRNRLVILPETVVGPTRFTMQERTDGYVGVEISSAASGFRRPLQLTLSYAQCDSLPLEPSRLKIYYVQGERVIAAIPSEVNVAAQTVTTVQIDHLSGYLVGGN